MTPAHESPPQVTELAPLYLADVKARFDSIKTMAERAAAQVDDAAFFRTTRRRGEQHRTADEAHVGEPALAVHRLSHE